MPVDAKGQLIGYLYQIQYSLKLLVSSEDYNVRIAIENIDDINLIGQSEQTIYQLKHSIANSKISNSSVNFWKTIYNWLIFSKDNNIDTTKFIMVTNMSSTNDSIIRSINNQELDEAVIEINKIIKTSASVSNKTYFDYISKTDELVLKELLTNVVVLVDQENISELKPKIMHELKFAVSKLYLEDFYQRLLGFWYDACLSALHTPNESFINYEVLYSKIVDLSQEYRRDNLPSYEEVTEQVELEEDKYEDKVFVKQLELINISSKRITHAIYDYYKAQYLRSNWTRLGFLVPGELEKYEKKLIREWENLYYAMIEEIGHTKKTENELSVMRRKLYNSVISLDERIREKFNKSYFMTGNYHMLADNYEVGWHEKYKSILLEGDENV